jgi:nicotinate-nucleotide adenylyltransferase
MVKKAIQKNKNFSASDLEIKRTGKSYTIDTIQEILRSYIPATKTHADNKDCEVFLILGSDSLQELVLWKNIKTLSELCCFVIVNRPGYSTKIPGKLENLIGKDKALGIEKLRVEIEPVGISSTDIRQKLKMKASIQGLVPPCVERYIIDNGLYLPS